jgi:uncharacterized integral membrane protein (TIGR00697 family)
VKDYKYLIFISGLFAATLLISNTLDTKIFTIGNLALPAGIILFPLAYVFGDVLTEVYGYTIARRVIWTGFAGLILMLISYEIARAIPPANFWEHQEAFDTIFSHIPRIAVASVTAYFCGEFINSYIVAKMKVKMQGKQTWLRLVLSTVAGQFVDTSVFVAIAFIGVFTVPDLITLILSAWAIKVAWEIIALPLTLFVVSWLKKTENVDFYDTNTNFNPFSVNNNNH